MGKIYLDKNGRLQISYEQNLSNALVSFDGVIPPEHSVKDFTQRGACVVINTDCLMSANSLEEFAKSGAIVHVNYKGR